MIFVIRYSIFDGMIFVIRYSTFDGMIPVHDIHTYLDPADANEGEVALNLLELVRVPQKGVSLRVIPFTELIQRTQGVSVLHIVVVTVGGETEREREG